MRLTAQQFYSYFSSKYDLTKPSPKGWYSFDCPMCGGRNKRAVHFRKEVTKCWTCDVRGKLVWFVQQVEDLEEAAAIAEIAGANLLDFAFQELESVYGEAEVSEVILPHGWKSITDGNSVLAKRARSVLIDRGFSLLALDNKGFGYVDTHSPDFEDNTATDFFGYIIVPVKKDGILRYYIGRDFIGNYLRYKNPPANYVGIGKDSVIYNEDALALYDEVSISEGWADAETWGDAGIATLGWSLSDYQMSAIMKSRAKRLVFVPDAGADKVGKTFYKKAVKAATTFLDSGKDIYVVDLNTIATDKKKDTNELGREAVYNHYKTRTPKLTWSLAMDILSDDKL